MQPEICDTDYQAKNGEEERLSTLSLWVGTLVHLIMRRNGASKAGMLQLTRALGVEWIRHNINIDAVSPGVTLTPRIERETKGHPEFFKSYFERIPARRAAAPEDIANAVSFLASSDADHVVGQVIIVDGGVLALHPGYVWPEQ